MMNRRRVVSAIGSCAFIGTTNAPFTVFGSLGRRSRSYTFSVETRSAGNHGLEFEAHILDDRIEQGDPGVVEFQTINRGAESVRVHSGPPFPFGVLYGYRSGRPVISLWADAYDHDPGVETRGRTVRSVVEISTTGPLSPEESLSETYKLDALQPGFMPGTVDVRRASGDRVFERTAPLEAELVIESIR